VGSWVNIALFLIGITFLRGGNLDDAITTLQAVRPITLPTLQPVTHGQLAQDWGHIVVSGYKVWPLVSILSFTLIPVERRILFGSFVGLCWGIYVVLYITS
jgi:hypothetical protein